MAELRLAGFDDSSIGGYLGALGLFRAIGRQLDSRATLRFAGDGTPTVQSDRIAGEAELVSWILKSWVPTPIASPWNKGAGFYGSSKATKCSDGKARNGVELIQSSTDERLSEYRSTLSAGQCVLEATGWPEEGTKAELFHRLRAQLPDAAVEWLDSCGIAEGADVGFPSLLGTGGNDGRLDFGNNFMMRLCSLIDFEGNLIKRGRNASSESEQLLHSCLFGTRVAALEKDSSGQFSPSSRAAPNGTSGTNALQAGKLSNPWGYVWTLEGCLWFAGAATRRLGSHGSPRAAFPFHARSVAADYGSAAVESGKDEIWVPLWNQPAELPELLALFGEARARVGRRQARDGLDLARAVATLGTARGVDRFRRYSLLERAGLSNIAVPLGTYATRQSRSVDLLRELDGWLGRFGRLASDKHSPPRYGSTLRRYERAAFELARFPEEPKTVVGVLEALGEMVRHLVLGGEFTLARSLGYRGEGWLSTETLQASIELRLAAAMASLTHGSKHPFLSAYLLGKSKKEGPKLPGAASLSATSTFVRILQSRVREGATEDGEAMKVGVGRFGVSLGDITAFVHRECSDQRLRALVWALSAPRIPTTPSLVSDDNNANRLPRSFVSQRILTGGMATWPQTIDDQLLRLDSTAIQLTLASRIAEATARATRRLRMAGFTPNDYSNTPDYSTEMGLRQAAALVIPLSNSAYAELGRLAGMPTTPEEKR